MDEINGPVHHILTRLGIPNDCHDERLEVACKSILHHCEIFGVLPNLLYYSILKNVRENLNAQFNNGFEESLSSLLSFLGLTPRNPVLFNFLGHTVSICEQHHEVELTDLVKHCLPEMLNHQFEIRKYFNCVLQEENQDVILFRLGLL